MPTRRLTTAELSYAKTGTIPPSLENPSAQLLRSRVIDCNFRKAEALLTEAHPLHPHSALDEVRVLLARGKTGAAEKLIATRKGTSADFIPAEEAEWFLESARLANACAQWAQAETHAQRALSLSPTGPTLLTLHQVLSIAQFEQGNLTGAYESVQRVLALAELYPQGLAVLYARTLLVKLKSRTLGIRAALFDFRILWQECLEAEVINLDAVLTLLRVQADLKRAQKKDWVAEAAAAYHLAKEMGDDLFELMALVELRHANEYPHLQAYAAMLLSAERIQSHPRVQDLLDPDSASESAKNLRLASRKSTTIHEAKPDLLDHCTHLAFLSNGILLALKSREKTPFSLQPKVRWLLRALSNRILSEGALFSKIWKIKRYSKTLHHENLRTVFRRLKTQTGIAVVCEHEQIYVPAVITIGEVDE